MLDFNAYADRIGLGSRPTLGELHRAHVFSIPFENLDPHRGVPVSLEPEALERKLVAQRRGGYCFEQNLLLMTALEELGHEVAPMLARVRLGSAPGTIRPRSHLVLRVRDGAEHWLADVGFGLGTPIEPIPFVGGVEAEQFGWRFRLVEEGRELVLQTESEDGWDDMYAFIPDPVPVADIEMSNWYTSTWPRSPFVTGFVAAAQRPDGTRASLSDWTGELSLTVRTPNSTTVTPVERGAAPALLDAHFGLPGFTLRDDGRVVPAA